MKITLEMQAEEQGTVTIRQCDCRPNGGYASQGKATLKRNGDASIKCDCGRNYAAEWVTITDPKTDKSTPNIVSVNQGFQEVAHITFDNYVMEREVKLAPVIPTILNGDEAADIHRIQETRRAQ